MLVPPAWSTVEHHTQCVMDKRGIHVVTTKSHWRLRTLSTPNGSS